MSRHTRSIISSPPPSVAGGSQTYMSATPGQALKVVTRLALEGKAQHGKDSASMRMYLKISIPVDSAIPGSTIPLFPEENLKILDSVVHPLDGTSAPYHFSSKTAPILHNAARALSLPARVSQSYLSLFPISSFTSGPPQLAASSRSSSNGIHPPLLDEKYTGHILVSGYQVSYVLPKDFPPKAVTTPAEGRPPPFASMHSRRPSVSVSERSAYQFMAAIDMLVPLLTKPPRAPYLLSIPLPRCLSNQIKLRIFPPTTMSQSFASLSSAGDETGEWDLTSEPHVTRTATRHSRSSSYAFSQYADDESSDSSTAGFADGCGLQGTFPSTDVLRVRWAVPAPAPAGALRRTGVADVRGETTCVLLGADTRGTRMRISHKGTCKGVWYAGVATRLGLDVCLDAPGCDVLWEDTADPGWIVTGDAGFTGWHAGEQDETRPPSPDSPVPYQHGPRQRMSSAGSTASLLRADYAAPTVPDFSFESATSTPTGSLVSSMGSLRSRHVVSGSEEAPTSVNGHDGAEPDPSTYSPAVPLTLHIDMNGLLTTPRRSTFTFHIAGTVLVCPRPGSGSSRAAFEDGDALSGGVAALPRFRVLAAADSQAAHVLVRNDAPGARAEVFAPAGDLRAPQTRKTVLARGALTRCGPDGGRVALRAEHAPRRPGLASARLGATAVPSRPVTPGAVSRRGSFSTPANRTATLHAPDAPRIIPNVLVVVTPLPTSAGVPLAAYGVQATFFAPANADMEHVEFGLARRAVALSHNAANDINSVAVDGICASLDGVPVHFEVAMTGHSESKGLGIEGLASSVDNMRGFDWISWLKVHTGGRPGKVQVSYVVRPQKREPEGKGKGKLRQDDQASMALLVPSFTLPVGKLNLDIEAPHGCRLAIVESNLSYRRSTPEGLRLAHFPMEELFRPMVSIRSDSSAAERPANPNAAVLSRLFHLVLLALVALVLFKSTQLQQQVEDLRQTIRTAPSPSHMPIGSATVEHATTTVTHISTFYTNPPGFQWQTQDVVPSATFAAPTGTPHPATVEDAEPPAALHTIPSPVSTVFLENATPSPAAPAPEAAPLPDQQQSLSLSLPHLRFPEFIMEWRLPEKQEVVDSVMTRLRKVWRLYQVVVHYPLPPPP